ncbi:MAG TPA: hypothetical protein VFE48_12300 [Methylomirabilota bacterium]|nr:hypothetical protein [Methylomirabilota bacterium]
MKKTPKQGPTETPRIGRKDEQDPDREPRDRAFDHDDERSDRDAGAGRPVQLEEDESPRGPDAADRRPRSDVR